MKLFLSFIAGFFLAGWMSFSASKTYMEFYVGNLITSVPIVEGSNNVDDAKIAVYKNILEKCEGAEKELNKSLIKYISSNFEVLSLLRDSVYKSGESLYLVNNIKLGAEKRLEALEGSAARSP